MTKKIRSSLIVVMLLGLLLMLTGCESGKINTSMELDSSFSGQRVMSFKLLVTDLKLVKVDDVVAVLSENCPEELKMTTEKGRTSTECTFTLSFNSLDDYTTKVTALRGSAPSITYTAPSYEEIFSTGFSLKEDFTSAELFKWAEEALTEKYSSLAGTVSDNITKGDTVVVFEGREIETTSAIDVKPEKAHLDRVVVNTVRYGEDDYSRTVSIYVDNDNLSIIGEKRFLEGFCYPLANKAAAYANGEWDAENGVYNITMSQSSRDTMLAFTKCLFPDSDAEYSDLADGAFTESSSLYEKFDLSAFPCADDGTASFALVYTAGDDNTFGVDSVTQENGGKISADRKTLTYEYEGESVRDVTVISETRYSVDSMSVETELTLTGNLKQSIIIGFPAENSRSAAARAQRFLSEQYDGTGLAVAVQQTSIPDIVSSSDIADIFALTLSAQGTPEEVAAVMTAAFGEGNTYDVTKGSELSIKRTYNVTHNVDISDLAEAAAYNGSIYYRFTAPMSQYNVARWDNFSGGGSDILNGRDLSESFECKRIDAPAFTVTFQYKQINLPFILGALITIIAGGCILVLISNFLSARLNKRRTRRKDDLQEEAVKSVALALVPEDERGGELSIPTELTRRPMVLIEPRNDDGLDEPEDEPEGLLLFISTLKILLIALMVLFFFPFCFVSSTFSTQKISGWDIFMGKELFGTTFPADHVSVILLVIPFIMLLCLYAHKMLPRIITPMFLTGVSLFQIFYLYRLPDSLDENIALVRQMVTGYITDPSTQMQMAHTYSMVIYVLIAISGVLLLFADLGLIINRKRREEECR